MPTQNPNGSSGGGGPKSGETFVQADSKCFRDLVQRLTGPSGSDIVQPVKPKRLHERRRCIKPKLDIPKPNDLQFQPMLQPSPTIVYPLFSWSCPASPSNVVMLTPPISLQSSPVSYSNKRASSMLDLNIDHIEEERAIREKRFYLHPSPRSKPRLSSEPELLTLFPLEGSDGGSDDAC